MITAIVPSPVYCPIDKLIKGRTVLPVLPDFMLDSPYKRTEYALNKFIGEDLIFNNIKLFKIYDFLDGDLYGYSVAELPSVNNPTGPKYALLSVKRHSRIYHTYLYVKSIESYVNIVRPYYQNQLNQFVSVSEFFDIMMSKSNYQDVVSDKSKIYQPRKYDKYFSPETPAEIRDLIFELGNECLSYSADAFSYLYQYFDGPMNGDSDTTFSNYAEAFSSTTELLSAVNAYRTGLQLLDLTTLNSIIDHNSNKFYNALASNQIITNQTIHTNYLDTDCLWYSVLNIEDVLAIMYDQPATDIYAVIDANHIQASATRLFGAVHISEICFSNLQVQIRNYNDLHAIGKISAITISKTWLDEFYLTVALDDGTLESWFLNMALYHLYSPSILRIDLTTYITSTQK